MQSGQVPNVGVLLSKKGYDGEGEDVGLMAFLKYQDIVVAPNDKMEFRFGGRCFKFLIRNEVFLPGGAGRVNAMES